MNIITIDPSQNSTAMCINGSLFNYPNELKANTKKGLSKWFDACSHLVDIKPMSFKSPKGYSTSEVWKLGKYAELARIIKFDVINAINPSNSSVLVMEGYSYSSASGKLIDLVTLGTLIRYTLSQVITNIHIVSPTSLKLSACKLSYDPVDVGVRKPKMVYQNNDGVKGGSFKKHEIYKSITENGSITGEWKNFLLSNSCDILSAKNVPTPIDDLNDAFILYQLTLNKINSKIPLDFN